MSISISMTEMLEAGVHYGHKKSRWHPKMKEYIYGIKNNIHIVDLNKSVLRFVESLDFLRDMSARGKVIMIVGTKPQAANIIKETAEKAGCPYVINRWLGGTMTNFKTIKERTKKLKELEDKLSSGSYDILTKKERLGKSREMAKMYSTLGGIKDMKKIPDVLFVTDVKQDIIAIREAKFLHIPVVGIVDTNVNPALLDYVIPGNDDSITSLKYIYDKVAQAISHGKANPIVEKKVEKKEVEKQEKKESVKKEVVKKEDKKVEKKEDKKKEPSKAKATKKEVSSKKENK